MKLPPYCLDEQVAEQPFFLVTKVMSVKELNEQINTHQPFGSVNGWRLSAIKVHIR